jgi:hypothetical protein
MTRLIFAGVVWATIAAAAAPANAQGRRIGQTRQEIARAQGVPPGQLPPPELCRVWYRDRPAGRQPSATSCGAAERIASRDGSARVIYGESAYRIANGDPYYDRNGSRYPDDDWNRDRAVRRPGRVRDPRVGNTDRYDRYDNPAWSQGYRDGLDKGREDARDNDRYDLDRHSWYRSADRGYESRYGSRAEYRTWYRDAFEAGYQEGYRVYQRR